MVPSPCGSTAAITRVCASSRGSRPGRRSPRSARSWTRSWPGSRRSTPNQQRPAHDDRAAVPESRGRVSNDAVDTARRGGTGAPAGLRQRRPSAPGARDHPPARARHPRRHRSQPRPRAPTTPDRERASGPPRRDPRPAARRLGDASADRGRAGGHSAPLGDVAQLRRPALCVRGLGRHRTPLRPRPGPRGAPSEPAGGPEGQQPRRHLIRPGRAPAVGAVRRGSGPRLPRRGRLRAPASQPRPGSRGRSRLQARRRPRPGRDPPGRALPEGGGSGRLFPPDARSDPRSPRTSIGVRRSALR